MLNLIIKPDHSKYRILHHLPQLAYQTRQNSDFQHSPQYQQSMPQWPKINKQKTVKEKILHTVRFIAEYPFRKKPKLKFSRK